MELVIPDDLMSCHLLIYSGVATSTLPFIPSFKIIFPDPHSTDTFPDSEVVKQTRAPLDSTRLKGGTSDWAAAVKTIKIS